MNRVRHSAFHVWPYRFNPATILVEITTMQTVISTIVFVLLLLAGVGFVFYPEPTRDFIDSVISPNGARYFDLERLERDGDRVIGWRRERVDRSLSECRTHALALRAATSPTPMVRCVAYTKDSKQLRIVTID